MSRSQDLHANEALHNDLDSLLSFVKDGSAKSKAHISAFLGARPPMGQTATTLPVDRLEERMDLARMAQNNIRRAELAKEEDIPSFKTFKLNLIQFSWFLVADLGEVRTFVRLNGSIDLLNSLNSTESWLAAYLQRGNTKAATVAHYIPRIRSKKEKEPDRGDDDDGDEHYDDDHVGEGDDDGSEYKPGLNPNQQSPSNRERENVSYPVLFEHRFRRIFGRIFGRIFALIFRRIPGHISELGK